MIEQLELMIANRYFERRMRTIFVDRVCAKGIETFEQYLSYRYRDNCYYYSGYAIIGLKDDDYLMRGDLCISGDFIWGNGGYSHGWVEFAIFWIADGPANFTINHAFEIWQVCI